MAYHRELAQHFTVYAPSHPGYGQSSRPDWISTINDMAHFYRQFIEDLDLAPCTSWALRWVAGWRQRSAPCVLPMSEPDPGGCGRIKPEVGEIAEILMVSSGCREKAALLRPDPGPDFDTVVNRQLTADEEAVQWRNREMTSRLCWKPYFHNPKLPAYLRGVKVPRLIVWGRQDAIVPLNCGELYQRALVNPPCMSSIGVGTLQRWRNLRNSWQRCWGS